MAGRLIGNGSANSSTVASPSANRRTIERRVGSDKAAKTTSNRSGAATLIAAPVRRDISYIGYLTERLHTVKEQSRTISSGRSVVSPTLTTSPHHSRSMHHGWRPTAVTTTIRSHLTTFD